MIILSVRVGYREPPIDLWLTECLEQLYDLKNKGTYNFLSEFMWKDFENFDL